MNVVLHIKKKWKKPALESSATATTMTAAPEALGDIIEGDGAGDLEDHNEDLISLNAPVRSKSTMPLRIPNNIPYTRKALFDLLKFIEYSPD